MSLPTNIVVIGAGSASFGENTLSALMRSKRLHGSRLALVDRNTKNLDIVHRLAQRLNREWEARMQISAHTQHTEALEGADFVISAIEVGPREELWRQDYEIPLQFGVRQPYGENGGPGGFAHAARNIGPLMKIVRDMEQACPQAWLINFTNPMMRICDAVNRHSKIKCVGLCHQVYVGYDMIGLALAKDLGFQVPEGITGMHSDVMQYPLVAQVTKQAVQRIEMRAAGLNHFTWVLSIHDKESGEDLYPLFRERWAALSPDFEPLTRAVFEAFGIFPVPGDTHLAEYLPWMSNPETRPWEKFNLHLYDWELFAGIRDFTLDRLTSMADGIMSIENLMDTDSEGALEMVENIAGGGEHLHQAANLPNQGQIPNLPLGATVETQVVVNGGGVQPVHGEALPQGVAELCRREITAVQLCVDAAVYGDRQKALECLLLDPVITDMKQARQVLDAYLEAYRAHLPQFWQ